MNAAIVFRFLSTVLPLSADEYRKIEVHYLEMRKEYDGNQHKHVGNIDCQRFE